MSLFRERRDWFLLILTLPLGIMLMLLAGQWATRLMPSWRIFADISSKVDAGDYPAMDSLPDSFAPVNSDIMTPMPWANSFLTPGAQTTDTGVVPLTILNPSATPTSPTLASPSPTAIPPTITATPSSTSLPTGSPTASPTAPATNTPDPEDPPSATPTSPSPTATLPTSTPPTPTPSATLPPVTSTIDPALTALPTTPAGFNEGVPDGINALTILFPDGSYFVVDVSSNPVVVNVSPDGHYDLVFYEDENPDGSGEIALDQVIIGITNDPGGNNYYEVFNWGDGIPDTNTNVNTSTIGVPTAEIDNQAIPTTDLYEDPSSPPSSSDPQTGILIDVDQAASHPPPDTYDYVVVIAPPNTNPNNAGDGGQVDSIQVTEVSSPAPP